MAEPFLSEIRAFGFNFAPKGWATCDGQTLAINQNQALYSLLGTTYGGNGTTTFNLPDLRGRTPIHFDASYREGQKSGSENVTLTTGEMPMHAHTLEATTSAPAANTPASNLLATLPADKANFTPPANANIQLNPGSIAAAGGSYPHNNMQPSLVINFCIALLGIFPSRS
jgi:microcystin-dependent protein